jgi:hypothetical protein
LSNRSAQKKTPELTKSSHVVKASPRWLKISTALLLVFLVFAQISYLGRNTIHHMIAKAPPNIQEPSKLVFSTIDQAICQLLPCHDEALRDFSAWSIEFAHLEIDASKDKETSSVAGLLKLQIRNQLNNPVIWPSVILSITDINDALIGEILLEPQDWLPKDANLSALEEVRASPLQEVASNLPLSLPESAAGYRVRLSYSPKTPLH